MMDRSTLEAYVDGALAAEEAERVGRHLAGSADDRAYVDDLVEMKALLAAAYAAPLTAPVPEALRAAVLGPPVRAPLRERLRSGWAVAALAAGVALVVGIAIGQRTAVAPGLPWAGPVAPGTALHALLEGGASGTARRLDGGTALPIGSYRAGDGRPCREIEALAADGAALTRAVACRDADAWRIEVAIAEARDPAPDAREAYVPAAGAGDAAIGEALDALEAGQVLTWAEEADLIGRGWRP